MRSEATILHEVTDTAAPATGVPRTAAPPDAGRRLPADSPAESLVSAVTAATDASDTWPDPIPLSEPVCHVPFPIDVLPPVFAAMANELSIATQTPAALPGMMILGAMSTAVIHQGEIHVRPGHIEQTNLFSIVIAESSERKSPIEREVKAPIREFEAARSESIATLAQAAKQRRQEISDELEGLQKAVESDDADASERAKQLLAEGAAIVLPRQRRLFMDDATPKAVAERMQANNGPLALWSSEGGDMLSWMTGRNGGSRMGVYLQAYSAEPIEIDRVDPTASVFIERPALCVAVMVQPTVMSLLGNPEVHGRGLTARFLFAVPASRVGYREVDAPAVHDETRRAYHDAIRALMSIAPPDSATIHTMRLSTEALKCLQGFQARIEVRLRPEENLYELRSWAGKLPGAVVRMAALLSLARSVSEGVASPWSQPVGEPEMASAVRLAEEFLIPHARVAFGVMAAKNDVAAAKQMLARIRRRGMRSFTPRQMQQAMGGSGTRKQMVDPGLRVLEAHEYVRRIEPSAERATGPKRMGRPPGEFYRVNPKALVGAVKEIR